MTDGQLAFYSAWASIIGLAVSLVSLLYVRSIKTNIIRFRRKQRLRELVNEIASLKESTAGLETESQTKLLSLKRNILRLVTIYGAG